VVVNGTGTAGSTYTILSATGGRTGVYSGVIDNIPFTTANLTYDPNDVFIVLTALPTSLAVVGQTFNQRSVAGATGNLGPVFFQLATLPQNQLLFALDQLSGEIHASNVTVGLENHSLFLRTVADRLRQGRCLCGDDASAPGCEYDNASRSWATPFGLAGHDSGNGNAHGFGYDSVGFAAGMDRWLGQNTLIGFAAGYDNWENRTDLLGSRAEVDSFQLGLYAYEQLGGAWLLGTVSYEYDGYHTRRPIDFLAVTARGNYSGNQAGSYLEAGYDLPVGGLEVQPIGAVQYISLWRDSFTETGAGAVDLNVASARADSFRSYLGGRVVYPMDVLGQCLLPEVRAFWVHEYAADTRNITNQFAAGGPAFLIYGQNLGRDWGNFGLGLSMQLGNRARIGLHYEADVTANSVAHGGMAQVQVTW
jgi:outer membrane autotransporter protein